MKEVQTQKAPAAIGPYSQGISFGSVVYTSGQIPVNPQTGEIPATIEEQTAQSLRNAQAVLEAAGFTMDNVVKTLVFLSDLGEFAAMNEVYASFFQQPYPARSCVQVAAIPKGAKVEIECIAVR